RVDARSVDLCLEVGLHARCGFPAIDAARLIRDVLPRDQACATQPDQRIRYVLPDCAMPLPPRLRHARARIEPAAVATLALVIKEPAARRELAPFHVVAPAREAG